MRAANIVENSELENENRDLAQIIGTEVRVDIPGKRSENSSNQTALRRSVKFAGIETIMSKTEILLELPKLQPEERREIWIQLNELDGPINDEWTDEEMSAEERALIESRLDECDKNPGSFVPWEVAEARLKARFGS